MNRRRRTLKQSIFIACEGKTEEKYFSAIGDDINEDPNYSVKVKTLEIEDGVPQDPLGLVKEAFKIKVDEGHDEAWAVFDKDRDPNTQIRNQAFNFAWLNNVNIAYSSIAFEHWILLHFEKNQTVFNRCDCGSRGDECICNGTICVCGYLKANHFPDYKKGGSYRLYGKIKSRNLNAIENSAWLKFQNRNQLSPTLLVQAPYSINPHTDVDILLVKLFGLDKVIFSSLNTDQVINGLTISVLSLINGSLKLRITNNRTVSYLINNTCDFKIRDSNGNLYPHAIQTPVLINSGQTQDVYMTFAGLPNIGNEFRMKDSNLILIVPI